jgi:hypothetical protein
MKFSYRDILVNRGKEKKLNVGCANSAMTLQNERSETCTKGNSDIKRISTVENNPAGDNIEEETRWGPRQAINICLPQLQY